MKTADRILKTSLTLFNEQGERNVTAADVALELDISPGNLYYHFKGKDDIIAALWQQHQRALAGTLSAPMHDRGVFDGPDGSVAGRIERAWLYLTVVIEEMYEHRFIYYNLDDLMHRFEAIQRGVPRLIALLRAACTALTASLLTEELEAEPGRSAQIAESMTLTLTYWLSYDRMQRRSPDPLGTIHGGVLQALSVCAPYLGNEAAVFYDECESLYHRMLLAQDE
ncbi:MAG: TetR/AcrR family transcriptional regulator [Halieaceae bacterium]|jgi:AcrR family transcriptional regulator|nr:TetR/AcrR family transcriptional regulator [Halieaceae bacterium]